MDAYHLEGLKLEILCKLAWWSFCNARSTLGVRFEQRPMCASASLLRFMGRPLGVGSHRRVRHMVCMCTSGYHITILGVIAYSGAVLLGTWVATCAHIVVTCDGMYGCTPDKGGAT